MIMIDLVYEAIGTHIARHAPERGGALYGPRGRPVITHFEYDADAETTAVSYVPSSRLIRNVVDVERGTGLQFKGIVHSHPAGFIRPSSGDAQTVQSFFRLNPHVSGIALPIVQEIRVDDGGAAQSFMHCYRAERRGSESYAPTPSNCDCELPYGIAIIEEDLHVIPLSRHVSTLLGRLSQDGFDLRCDGRPQRLSIANAELIGLTARGERGHEFIYLASYDYPFVAPVVLFQNAGVTRNLALVWNGFEDVEKSLESLATLLVREWAADKVRSETEGT